jgi:RHS repeat-associated protein
MKKYILQITCIVLFFVCTVIKIYGQTGNTFSNPIVAGSFSSAFNYSNSQNTNSFTNNYTVSRPTNDVYYKFTLNKKMEVTMRHCGSTLSDTYLSLLDASGNRIDYNDDYSGTGACSSSALHSYLKKELDAGTYYVVSEGYSQNGVILTQISGTVIYLPGDSRQDPVVVGTYGNSFQYSNTQNTVNFTSQHTTRAPNDVFYRFTLNKKMNVTLTHCGSNIDTYMHLLDISGNTITYNDDNSGDGACSSTTLHSFIQKVLEPGTYYVVSEGYSGSGSITTNITGYAAEDFGYPDIPTAYSTEPEAVGSIEGTFNVSATGGATYSIPIEVPQGVGSMQPSLAIVYNSQSGNGMLGWGCNLSGLSAITRAPKDIYHNGTAKGLTYLADDVYLLDGQRLIYSSGTVGQEGAIYYLEADPFTKITVHGTYNTTTANTWFEVQASNGFKYYYGNTTSGRQTYTAGSSPRINAWYLDYVEDPLGNYMTYTYNKWSYYMYPNVITYGNNKNEPNGLQNTVTFGYEYRSNDAIPFVMEGVKGSMSYRLKTITSKTGNNTYRIYGLQYNITSDNTETKFSRLTDVTEKNGAGEALKPVKLNWSYLPSFSQSANTLNVNAASVYPSVTFSEQQFIAADFNGDGLADIVGISPVKIPTGQNSWQWDTYAYIYWASLDTYGNVQYISGKNYSLGPDFQMGDWKEQRAGSSAIDFDGDGINEFLAPHASINDHWKQIGFYFYSNTMQRFFGYNLQRSSEMPAYSTGDFNNDGKGDVVYMEKGHSSNKYPCEIVGLNHGTELYRASFNLTLPSKPEKMFVSDYNGDRLEDVLVFYSGGYTIFWNQGTGITNTTLSDSKKTTGSNIGNAHMIRPGDFNGDGLMDFLINGTNDNTWYFALNNGNGTFTKTQACVLNIYDQDFTEKDNNKFDCLIYDFDFDGKSDVVITKAMYDKHDDMWSSPWGVFNKTYTCWMRSTGSSLSQVKVLESNIEDDAASRYIVAGDFNGDGQMELLKYGYNGYSTKEWRMYKNGSYTANREKIASIIDGYGSQTSISYASFANSNIYTKGSGSAYPVADYTLPIPAVSTVTQNNGAAGSMSTNYRYSGLKIHLQGKGLLGMTSSTASNTTLGTVTESGVKSWNTTFFVPSETYTKTTVDGKTAETNIALTITDKGSKKYFAFPSTKTEKDLDGNILTTTYQFNSSYGYPEEEKAVSGDNMYKTVQYGNYILAGKTYQPQLITRIQKHEDDASAFTQKTSVTYDASKGYKKQIIENYGSSLPLTTDFTYDAFGNRLTSTISGSGIATVTTHYTYDATKRFVTKAYSTPASSITGFTYDTWGNVLTEKDETLASNILTTTHTYDNWGNRISTVLPDGVKTTFTSGWNNNNARKRFFTLTQGKNRSWVKTWYDNRGREVLTETVGAQSLRIQESKTYNSKGQLTEEKVQAGNLTTTEAYTYEGRGRIASQSSSAGQSVSYTYDNRKVTSLTNGKTYTKTYDAWGAIKTSTDPVETVSYTYKSLGKPQKITAAERPFSMTYYDDTGNQKTLNDPNTGTITYTYDAAGRLLTQKDGRGKMTSNVYDALGRIATSTIDGTATVYTYGTSGYALLRLTKQQTGSNYIAYSYDSYGRVLSEKRQIEGEGLLEFTYGYNTQGQLNRITYPGGLVVNRQYDAYGNLKKIQAGTQDIWELTGATGTVTTTQLGGTLTATQTHNAQGLLIGLKTQKGSTVLHNMGYVFNGATGNLTSRSGMTGQTESFLYDDLNRLTTIQQGGATVMDIDYSSNGNIRSKTGLGEYSYGILMVYFRAGAGIIDDIIDRPYTYNTRPHAVAYVENTGDLIPYGDQSISYTAFNKVSAISETVGADSYALDILYGPDRQRWKSSLKKNDALTRTILYAGDYEAITENGVGRQLYYLGGGDGLAAVYVKQSGQADKIYYACKDHLGSIVKLVDGNGTEVFKASYDAWGKQTITNSTFKFYRGYTGHEHLPELSLINMNGRVYDPVLGRFLSPDPFVQMPDFSQSFNRYAYCINNPLIYKDSNGEFWHIIIGALVGGVINLTTKAVQGKINSWGDGFAAFGIGAAAGALGAATGGAAFAAAGGAAGGVGGFLAGSAGGAFGSAFSLPVLSMGNSAYFGDPMMTAKQYLLGIAGGALLGGSINGITALANGRNFMTGNLPTQAAPIVPTAPTPATNQNTTQTPAEKMSHVREMGRAAEDAVGINQADKVRIPSVTKTADYRVPDRLTPFTLEEVKNVSYLDYTPQLQDFVQHSQLKGLQMQLWIRPAGTIYGPVTNFSPSMQNVIDKGFIRVFYIPF